jgi:hypothetical protein
MRHSIIIGAAAFAMAAALPTAASATTKDDLVKKGYKCERGGINDIECTKKDNPTYTCDGNGKNCMKGVVPLVGGSNNGGHAPAGNILAPNSGLSEGGPAPTGTPLGGNRSPTGGSIR